MIDWGQMITATALAEAELQSRRATMSCSRLQGRLTLGEAVCAQLDALAADPATPWAMREAITNAATWNRSSQTIDELAYLLGFTAEQMDALFEQAASVTADGPVALPEP